MLNPTPAEKLCDRHGHPYFLWDVEMTLEVFMAQLRDPDADVRAHALGKLMRQARPDDALTLVSLSQIRADWERVERYLGHRRAFWSWLIPELERRALGTLEIWVDCRAEILVNKLAALYSRSEIRDLADVKALLEAGEDLEAALALVIRKDGGFSPPDLAWVLRTLNVEALARADGYEAAPLTAFRDALVARLLA